MREKISHLAFADDLMLFCRGDVMSLEILSSAVEEFSACSGLEINRGKSNLFVGGKLGFREIEELKEVFGFPLGSLPVRYLGVPLHSKMLNIMHYSPIIDKLADLTKKWKGTNLSYAGKAELIRSVLQGVECYWLQAFQLPVNVRDRIIGICRKFLWGTNHGPIGWKELCLPLEEGGLGFRDLGAWNKALIAKILWNIHSKKDTLWIKWIHSEYLRNRSVWEWVAKTRDSPLVKRLLEIRDKMLAVHSRSEIVKLWERWYSSKGTVDAYEWFRPKGERRLWYRFVWRNFVPPKYSFTTWQALHGKLATRDRLGYKDIDQCCPLCNLYPESRDHLFFKCCKTEGMWNEIKEWLGLRRSCTTISSAIKWISKDRSREKVIRKARILATIALISMTWKARNAVVFEQKPFSSNHIVFEVKKVTYATLYSLFPHERVQKYLGI